MTFTIELRLVHKSLDRMDHDLRTRLLRMVARLATNPRPPGAVKLTGSDSTWRVRVGDYRILYAIEEDRLVVLVLKIGHRREVYRVP